MADLFNVDFQDFIEALNKSNSEYILVGGYAVILHGYIRSTSDMDVWVNKSAQNYFRLKEAFEIFGAPIFTMEEFLADDFDVWSIGIAPNKIEIMNRVKGINFDEAIQHCNVHIQNKIEIKYLQLAQLLKAKQAAGRFKDLDDIEQLNKNKTR